MNLREQKARQTYENIILATEKLLEEKSFEALSVDQICAGAGISKGGFYHHFPSKEQLMSLMIGRQMGRLIIERIAVSMDRKNVYELMEIYVDTMIEYLESSPKNMLAGCWVALTEHADMLDTTFARESIDILNQIVVQGKKEGCIRSELDTEFCQAYLNGTLTGIMIYGVTYRESMDMRAFARQSLEMLWKTLQ